MLERTSTQNNPEATHRDLAPGGDIAQDQMAPRAPNDLDCECDDCDCPICFPGCC
jgi:hypothetical protein